MVYSKVCESTKLISIRRSRYDKQQKNHIVTGQIMSPEWNAKTVLVMDENYELWAMYEMHFQRGERFLYLINVFLRFRLTDGLVSSLKHNVLWQQRQRGTVRDETEGKKAVWNSTSKQRQALKKQLQSTGWQQDNWFVGKHQERLFHISWTGLNLLLMIIRATP